MGLEYVYTYIDHTFKPNVGKYGIHGAFGYYHQLILLPLQLSPEKTKGLC